MLLRDYQQRAIDDIVRNIDNRTLLVSPTGSGKTVILTTALRQVGGRVLWLAHRRELVQQAACRLREDGASVGVVMAGEDSDPGAQFQVASVQTLLRRDPPAFDVLAIDEAHHATSPQYMRLIAKARRLVGATATPFRLDGKGLRSAGFNRIVVAAYTDDLCAEQTLHEPTVFAAPSIDLSGVKKTAGDYNLKALSAAVGGAKLNGRIVDTWQKKAAGKRTVAFAVDVAHAETIVAAFLEAGVPAELVSGETPKAERDGVLARLAAGITLVVVNCQVLTEGWDLPSCEVAIIARPTASLCLHIQQIGRVMRACEGKDGAIVLDHAGNYSRHGLVTDRLKYDLDGKVKKAGGEAPRKTCPECAKVVPAGVHVCPECGHEFPREDKTTESDAELLPVGHKDSAEERQRKWTAMLSTALRIVRGQSGGTFGWDDKNTAKANAIAAGKYKARYGSWPLSIAGKLIDPRTASPGDWEQLRAAWRHIGTYKGWDAAKTEWFVKQKEQEARGEKPEKVYCAVRMDDGSLCGRPGRTMCQSHVTRKEQGRPMGEPWDFKRKNLDPKCSIIMDDGTRCDRDAVVGRICTMHQSRKRKGIPMGLPYHRGHPIKSQGAA